MDAVRNADQSTQSRDWKARIKDEAYAKVLVSPLLRGCAQGGDYPRALLGGFWYFVNEFPGIIRETYSNVPAAANEKIRRFLRRSAPALSGTLKGMEDDERAHRALWIRSASRVGLSEDQLQQRRVLPEVKSLTEAIRTEGHFARRLLYFVAVEIVAEGVARYLSQAPRFVELMGEEGMQWFTVHVVHPDDATTHEAVAYNLSLSAKRIAHEPTDEKSIDADIQRCVDWFFNASIACARDFASAVK
jgi:pyrroloquinoline quinone (PQQ) biosynthesis protein C